MDFNTAIVFKPIVNTYFLCNFNSIALHSLYCADVPLRNCSLTQSVTHCVSEENLAFFILMIT